MASERGCPASRLLLVTYCVPQFTISSRILSGKAAHPSPSGMSPPSGHPYFLFTAHSRCVIIRHPDWVTPQFTQNQLLRPEVPCIRFAWPHPSTGHYVELTPNSVPPVRLGPCPPPTPVIEHRLYTVHPLSKQRVRFSAADIGREGVCAYWTAVRVPVHAYIPAPQCKGQGAGGGARYSSKSGLRHC